MIQQKLNRTQEKLDKALDKAPELRDVKLLLDSDAQTEQHLLLNAFPNTVNTSLNNISQEREGIKKLEEIHNGKVYTIDEIKDLAIKYRLRFLPSTLYKGRVPLEAVHGLYKLLNINIDYLLRKKLKS